MRTVLRLIFWPVVFTALAYLYSYLFPMVNRGWEKQEVVVNPVEHGYPSVVVNPVEQGYPSIVVNPIK